MRIEHERWKLIEGTTDTEISNFGRVRTKGGFEYSTFIDSIGYRKVNLKINGTTRQLLIHILVAKAFVPNPFNKKCVNHKNGDKSNSCEWNLEWCTEYENQMHRRYVLGYDMLGSKNPMYGKCGKEGPKFKDYICQVNEDGDLINKFETQPEACVKSGIKCSGQISQCLNHRNGHSTAKGFYWMYEKEYNNIKSADLKPRELLEHPELWITHYRGQSAAKPDSSKY